MHSLTRLRPSQAIKIPAETLCPFLYQTRTITDQRSPPPSSTAHSHHNEDDTLTFLQRKARDVEARKARDSTLTSSERETFMNIMKNFGAKIDGIAIPPQVLASEPVRPSEMRSANYEPIKDSTAPLGPVSTRVTNRNVEDILSIFAPVETSQRFSVLSNSEADANSASVSTPQNVRQAAMQSLQYISSDLKTTFSLSSTTLPDLAIWRILETNIFPLITLLQTHNPPSATNPYQQTLGSLPSQHLPPSIYFLPPETPLLPLITILYPAATLLTLRTYVALLPSSGFVLALLPKIRSLGPASYLLAGNTHFFNALIYLNWTVYSDLRTIYNLLSEMRRSGVEYDQGTLDQIEEMRWQRSEDLKWAEGTKGNVSGRGWRWWNSRMQEEGWRRLMRKYRWDVLREGKRRGEEQELDEEGVDHEIR